MDKLLVWLLLRYAGCILLHASFADACLERMTETNKDARIFTLDSDFIIYRDPAGEPLPLIIP